MRIASALVALFFSVSAFAESTVVVDQNRNRQIPVEIYMPMDSTSCSPEKRCPVALVSAGNGVEQTAYSFLANTYTELGYLVIVVAHELPGDPPLAQGGNLSETRKENWQRGAETLKLVQSSLKVRFTAYDFDHLTLIGHSNGGDIAAWLVNDNPGFVSTLVTLDNRRVPLPRNKGMRVLSLRASEFNADAGVVPNAREQEQLGTCVIPLPYAKHNDLTDRGPPWVKQKVQSLITAWSAEQPVCMNQVSTHSQYSEELKANFNISRTCLPDSDTCEATVTLERGGQVLAGIAGLVEPVLLSAPNRQIVSCQSNLVLGTDYVGLYNLKGEKLASIKHNGDLQKCGMTDDKKLYWFFYWEYVGTDTANVIVVLNSKGEVAYERTIASDGKISFSYGNKKYSIAVPKEDLF